MSAWLSASVDTAQSAASACAPQHPPKTRKSGLGVAQHVLLNMALLCGDRTSPRPPGQTPPGSGGTALGRSPGWPSVV